MPKTSCGVLAWQSAAWDMALKTYLAKCDCRCESFPLSQLMHLAKYAMSSMYNKNFQGEGCQPNVKPLIAPS